MKSCRSTQVRLVLVPVLAVGVQSACGLWRTVCHDHGSAGRATPAWPPPLAHGSFALEPGSSLNVTIQSDQNGACHVNSTGMLLLVHSGTHLPLLGDYATRHCTRQPQAARYGVALTPLPGDRP
jgi:hypothetical protein